MAKQPRENRVPIMMSDEELTAIDDWRYANRVATRSDAVRRLAQIGLRMEREIENLMSHNNAVSAGIEFIVVEAKKLLNKESRDAPKVDTLVDVIRSMFQGADHALLRQADSMEHLFELVSEIAPLVSAEEFAESLKAANRTRANVMAGETVLKKILAEFDANRQKDADNAR